MEKMFSDPCFLTMVMMSFKAQISIKAQPILTWTPTPSSRLQGFIPSSINPKSSKTNPKTTETLAGATMGSNQAAVSFLTNLARAAFGLGTAATVLNASLYTVDGGQRAVLFDRFRGVIDTTVGEGTHFIVPWLQKPFIFDIRTRPHTFSSISGTKDLQMVNLTLRVLSRPEANLSTL